MPPDKQPLATVAFSDALRTLHDEAPSADTNALVVDLAAKLGVQNGHSCVPLSQRSHAWLKRGPIFIFELGMDAPQPGSDVIAVIEAVGAITLGRKTRATAFAGIEDPVPHSKVRLESSVPAGRWRMLVRTRAIRGRGRPRSGGTLSLHRLPDQLRMRDGMGGRGRRRALRAEDRHT